MQTDRLSLSGGRFSSRERFQPICALRASMVGNFHPPESPWAPGAARRVRAQALARSSGLPRRKRGIKIKLHGQPLEVLAMLLERPGEVVTREEIRQKLWPADTFVDFDHGL